MVTKQISSCVSVSIFLQKFQQTFPLTFAQPDKMIREADISQTCLKSVKTRTALPTVHVLQKKSSILSPIDVWMCAPRLFLRTTFSLVCLYVAAIARNDDLYGLSIQKKSCFAAFFPCSCFKLVCWAQCKALLALRIRYRRKTLFYFWCYSFIMLLCYDFKRGISLMQQITFF